jgi:hypothetical protein
MSFTFLLQENIKSNENLYKKIKIDEILYFINDLDSNTFDFANYESYFNNKCISDYKFSLLEQISLIIETPFIRKNKELQMYKLLHSLKNKIENGKLDLYLQKTIKVDDLLKFSKDFLKLEKTRDIILERRNQKSIENINQKISTIKNNILKISKDAINDVFKENKLDYQEVKNNLGKEEYKTFNNFINYFIKHNIDSLTFPLNEIEYIDLLVSILTKKQNMSLYEMLNGDITNSFFISNDLMFYLIQYKYLQEVDFKYFVNLISILSNYELINQENIVMIMEQNFDSIENANIDHKSKLLLFIFLNILQQCAFPENEKYIKYLQDIYKQLNISNEFIKIQKQSNEIMNLLDMNKTLFNNSLVRMKKGVELKVIFNYILKSYFNKEITYEEYSILISDLNTIRKIIDNKEENFEYLNQYMNLILRNEINNIIQFNLVLDNVSEITELEKKLKNFNLDDDYIKKQINLYKEIFSNKKNENFIFIKTHSMLKDDNMIKIMLKYQEWIEKSEVLKTNFGIDIIQNTNVVFQNIIANVSEHYLKGIQHYMNRFEVDEKQSKYNINNLFYQYSDKIRVYCENMFSELLVFIREQLNRKNKKYNPEFLHFFAEKLYYFLTKHNFYSKLHESEIQLINILVDDTIIAQFFNLFTQVNKSLKSNKLMEIDIDELIKLNKKLGQKNMETYLEKKEVAKFYNKIKNINKEHNILTENEILYLTLNNADFKFVRQLKPENSRVMLHILKDMILKGKEMAEERKLQTMKVVKDSKEEKVNESINNQLKLMYKQLFKDIEKQTKNKKYIQPKFVMVDNNGNDFMDNYEKYATNEGNDISRIELATFNNFYGMENEENEYESLIKGLVKSNVSLLMNIFDIKDGNINKELTDILLSNNLRIKSIINKLLYQIKYDEVYKMKSNSNSIINDIVKLLSLIHFTDLLTTRGIIDKYMNNSFMNQIEKESDKILRKNVLIINGKHKNNIGKVLSKKDNDNYEIKIKKQKFKISRNKFILVDNLKNKIVKVIRGPYKGMLGVMKDYKMTKIMKNEDKKIIKDNISINTKIINKNKSLIDKLQKAMKNDNIVDNVEFDLIYNYRKKKLEELKLKEDTKKNQQMIFKISLSINIRKVLIPEEKMLLDDERRKRIESLKISVANRTKDNIIFNKKTNQKNYIVAMHYGEKTQRNIYFEKDDIQINVNEAKINEFYNSIKKIERVEFKSIYEMLKYYYLNLNSYTTQDLSIIDIKYFHTILNNVLDIFNRYKMVKINKVKSKVFLEEKLKLLKENEEKIKNKLKKKKTSEMLKKLKNNTGKINLIVQKINEMKNINESDLIIQKDINELKDDLEIEQISGNQKFLLIKPNENMLKKELKTYKQMSHKNKMDENTEKQKNLNQIFFQNSLKVKEIIDSLKINMIECNLLSVLIDENDYINNIHDKIENVEDENVDVEDLSYDEILNLLDGTPGKNWADIEDEDDDFI